MLYSTIFVAALAAFSSVSAMPAEPADRDHDRDRYEVFRRGECRSERDELYCARSINEYSLYDEGSRYCRRDRVNRVFCAYREQREFARQIAEEWRRIEECELDEYWDIRRRRCECYRRRGRDGDRDRECHRRRGELEGDHGRDDEDRRGDRDDDRRGDRDDDRRGDRDDDRRGDRDDDRRGDRDGDRDRDDDDDDERRGRTRDAPHCKNGDIAFCAASEDRIVTFERENLYCRKGLGNYVFCASPELGRAREKAEKHFRKERKTAKSDGSG